MSEGGEQTLRKGLKRFVMRAREEIKDVTINRNEKEWIKKECNGKE